MTDQYVGLQPDSSGKKVDTSELTVGANTVERQRIVVADPNAAASLANVNPIGEQLVQGEPHTLLVELWASIDTTNTWNAATSSGGGVAAATSGGVVTLGTGTTANGYSYLTSQANWRLVAGGYIRVASVVSLEHPITANTYRFWGIGNPQAAPTAANPLSNAVGFEVTTSGAFCAVIYGGSTRNQVATSSTWVTDTSNHDYQVYVGTRAVYWVIDGTLVATSSAGATGVVQVASMPSCFLAVAGSSAPGSSGVITSDGHSISDTAANHHFIADATYPWRQSGVTAKGVQGTYAQTVQELKDAGRNPITLFGDAVAGVTAEGLMSLVQWKGGASVTATNFTVTSGKTFRVTSMTFSGVQTTTTVISYKARLRFVTSGTVATTSAVAIAGQTAGFAATNPSGATVWTQPVMDGYELAGGYNYGVSHIESATTCTVTVCITGYEY